MDQQREGQRAFIDQQGAHRGALVTSQSDMSRAIDASMQRTADQGAIVPQGQSQEDAQNIVRRLLEQTTTMFHEGTQGHAAMHLHLLPQMVGVLQQYPTVSVQHINNKAVMNQYLRTPTAGR